MTGDPGSRVALRLVTDRFGADIVTAFRSGELGWKVTIDGDRLFVDISDPEEIARTLRYLDGHPGVVATEIHDDGPGGP